VCREFENRYKLFDLKRNIPRERRISHNITKNSVFSPEGGGSMFLRRVGVCLQAHVELHRGRPTLTYPLLREPQTSEGVSYFPYISDPL
jgi:hypothetical protein